MSEDAERALDELVDVKFRGKLPLKMELARKRQSRLVCRVGCLERARPILPQLTSPALHDSC